MSETEQPQTPPEDEPAEREAQAEDPISPMRGFKDLEDAEAQGDESDGD